MNSHKTSVPNLNNAKAARMIGTTNCEQSVVYLSTANSTADYGLLGFLGEGPVHAIAIFCKACSDWSIERNSGNQTGFTAIKAKIAPWL
jgi:hypothetical protein